MSAGSALLPLEQLQLGLASSAKCQQHPRGHVGNWRMMTTVADPWTQVESFDLDVALDPRRRMAALPAGVRLRARALLEGTIDALPALPDGLVELVASRIESGLLDEIRGYAAAVEVPWQKALMANVSYDVMMAFFGCSTMALASPSGPVLARNLDWWPEELLARATCHLRMCERGRPIYSVAGFPSASGVVTGQSSRGFAVAINAVSSGEAPDLDGHPVLLLVRRVLERAGDFAEAVDALASEPLVVSVIFTVVGSANPERVVIERTTRHAELRRPLGDAPLLATNDYRKLVAHGYKNVLQLTACGRYDAMAEFLDGGPDGEHTDRRLLEILTDPRVRQTITAQHVIMRPSMDRMLVCVPTRLFD